MSSPLTAQADAAVHEAVDGFVAGYRDTAAMSSGEAIFETKNSRYRLLDGVLFSSNDNSLLGAEFIGWLLESEHGAIVQGTWMMGGRAVLLCRNKERQIVVTSSSRVFRVDGSRARRSEAPLAVAKLPPISPPPARSIPRCPPLPIGLIPGTTELSVATALLTHVPTGRPLPPPMPPPPALGNRVHAPPRAVPGRSRLPAPSHPPERDPPSGMRTLVPAAPASVPFPLHRAATRHTAG